MPRYPSPRTSVEQDKTFFTPPMSLRTLEFQNDFLAARINCQRVDHFLNRVLLQALLDPVQVPDETKHQMEGGT